MSQTFSQPPQKFHGRVILPLLQPGALREAPSTEIAVPGLRLASSTTTSSTTTSTSSSSSSGGPGEFLLPFLTFLLGPGMHLREGIPFLAVAGSFRVTSPSAPRLSVTVHSS
eukprot:543660-Rhodomonas_salina.2